MLSAPCIELPRSLGSYRRQVVRGLKVMPKPKNHWEVDFSQWTKERASRLRKKQERLSQEANAYDTIKMCYRRGLEKLVYKGEITKDTASRWAKIDAQLIELQSRPRLLMLHDARQRMFQHYMREHFPKKPLEKAVDE
ncbi:hypothetical protein FOZ63_000855 [Perkinsus olseni]|uniref:Uncharacterized protein n=1 Tax=Perkinsus olseni TaxID=32597 RepID=A0A7J6RFA5_PEROL|nr:hypothetical protein FOZ63_000855 [Perkinsus olseni]